MLKAGLHDGAVVSTVASQDRWFQVLFLAKAFLCGIFLCRRHIMGVLWVVCLPPTIQNQVMILNYLQM